MPFEGDLGAVDLTLVLQSIAAGDNSGILTVQGQDDIVAVSFLDGGIVAADALNQTVEEGLGEVLKSRKLIAEDDFNATIQDHQGGGAGSLGELLVGRGLISRDELLDALRIQTYSLMAEIVGWREGEFKFYVGDEISYEEDFKPIPVAELLVRSIEDSAEGDPSLPKTEAVYRKVPTPAVIQIFGRDGDGDGGGIWLDERQADLLSKLDGEAAAEAVATELGLDHYQTVFALLCFLRHGLAEPVLDAVPLAGLRSDSGVRSAPLMAEIFTPPEPGQEETSFEDEYAISRPDPVLGPKVLQPWSGTILAVFLVAALALAVLFRPGVFFLPFPWQDKQRGALERQLRESHYLKTDRTAKTYFLVKAHYPDSLNDMVDLGLLAPTDVNDPSGYALAYSTDAVGYRIDLLDGGQVVEGFGTTESITGDFLIDPQWLRPGTFEKVPLVLLD